MNKGEILTAYTSCKLKATLNGIAYSEELCVLENIITENKWEEEAKELYKKAFENYRKKEILPLYKKIDEELIPFLSQLTLWDSFKNNKTIVDIINEIKEKDNLFIFRRYTYLKLMELPKFKELSDSDKLDIALKIGACDTRELSK